MLVDFQRDTALDQLVVKGGYVLSLALTYPLLFCVMREVLVELAVVKEGGVIGGGGDGPYEPTVFCARIPSKKTVTFKKKNSFFLPSSGE